MFYIRELGRDEWDDNRMEYEKMRYDFVHEMRMLAKLRHPCIISVTPSSAERGGNTLNEFEHYHLKNGSSQGQNLALTGLFMFCKFD